MAIMPVFNATPSQRDPLPVKLDAKLSHIQMEFGTPGNDNLLSRIDALVDTGVGCTIGNLDHWTGKVLTNPSILAEDGKYAPLTMHSIVDPNAEGGNHTTRSLPSPYCLQATLRKGVAFDGGTRKGCCCKVHPGKSVVEIKPLEQWLITNNTASVRAYVHPDLKRFPFIYK